ncbi:DNA-binding transcriptional LysR family regulator [Arthrobacter ulcerisalmonis]|nr:LysR family transcriptional regulator [Arthrobacter ulcerisalmonis]MDQ0662121.1 DNA-binding transcriptional LysR family regulator [Arthrobacter ulcerisalmonis]
MSVKNLDLNLLPQLQVLLELRNVSRAAERLQLSQPATSAAMARLRRHFDDELLVRNGRTYDLTPFAQSLVPLVDEAMLHIQRATRVRSGFDPATSEREFVIAASDYAAALIVGPLRGILGKEAPRVSVDVIPTAGTGIQGRLADYLKIDMLVGPMGYQMQGASKQVFRDSFVAIADAGNPLLQQPHLTFADLATVPHAVGYFGEGISTPADKLFEAAGIQRRVAAVVAGVPVPSAPGGRDGPPGPGPADVGGPGAAGRGHRGAGVLRGNGSVPGGGHVLAPLPDGGSRQRLAALGGPALLRAVA